jgi:serine/threonine-protein kinase
MRLRRPDLPIPEALDQAVLRCLKKRLNERPRSAAELEQMLAAVPIERLPKSYPPGVSRRAPAPKARPITDDNDRTVVGSIVPIPDRQDP